MSTFNQDIIYSCFKFQATRLPAQVAVIDADRTVTYDELLHMVDSIASQLGEDCSSVGIIMDHGVEMIASILATLKVGAAYIPSEPTFPPERIRFMMTEGKVNLVITNRTYASLLTGFHVFYAEDLRMDLPESQPSSAVPNSLAYVLYTSGSTGKPKGVCVENRNVCHYVRAFQHEFHINEKDVMLQYSVCSFDIFTEEVFATLLSGATLAITPAAVKSDLHRVLDFVTEHNVTIISGFPYLLNDMNKLPSIPSSIRLLVSGGDVLRAKYVTNLLGKAEVYNTYGPSETTCCASYFRCTPGSELADGTYPIGKAVLGAELTIVDEKMQPVKKGERGEILIAGGGVSRGYMTPREEEAFVKTEDGRTVYLSGDLGYELPDGNIAFLKRKDSQVMILGKRIEVNEVEAVLGNSADVAQGVVLHNTDSNGLSYLTAYVVPANDQFSLHKLKQYMSQYLAPFMIPEFFVLMKEFPVTSSGKLDRGVLPKVLKEGTVEC